MKLIIAEKPSMAKKYRKAVKEKDVMVTNAIGHIENLIDIKHYLKSKIKKENNKIYWKDLVELLPLNIPVEKYKYKITNKKIFKNIIKYLQKANEIILACDPDREGELIHRNILEIAKNKGYVKTENITRIWLHSETKNEIQKAFKNRKSYKKYEGWYKSAKTRQLVDWIIGIQLTILYSTKYSKPGKPISIGRIQSWLLSEIVKRYYDNKNFKPKDYWVINFITNENIEFNMINDNNKIYKEFKEQQKNKIINDIKNKDLFITEVKKKNIKKNPKKLYDLKELQKVASKKYNISPEKTLKIAQSLYEKHHLISYPRTDCRVISKEEAKEVSKAIELLSKFDKYNKIIKSLNTINPEYKLSNKYTGKIKGHYAIIPVLSYDKENIPKLNHNEKKIFDLIAMKFLEIFFPPAKGYKTTTIGKIDNYKFRSVFKVYTQKGYMEYFKRAKSKKQKERIYKQNEYIKGTSESEKKTTKPKKLYNDNRILKLMENAHLKIRNKKLKEALKEANGIGTASTRSSFIPKLLKRNYIKKDKGKYIPTKIGEDLYKILPEELKYPDFSAKLEYELGQFIENPNKKTNKIIYNTYTFVEKIFSKIRNQKSKNILKKEKDTVGKCPKCKSKIIERKKGYFCSNKKCKFVIWKYNKYQKFRITKNNIKELLKKGRTKNLKTMTFKKNGKTFKSKAYIILDTNKKSNYKYKFK